MAWVIIIIMYNRSLLNDLKNGSVLFVILGDVIILMAITNHDHHDGEYGTRAKSRFCGTIVEIIFSFC